MHDAGKAPADAFAATVARAQLDEVSAAARRVDRISDLELIRLSGAVLRKAAIEVDVRHEAYGYDFEGLAGEIVRKARGKLSPGLYRCVYGIWDLLRRSPPVRDEASAPAA